MPPEEVSARPGGGTDEQLDRLTRLLAAQTEGHHRLLQCIGRKRKAIKEADIDSITQLCRKEQALAQGIREMERQRLDIVGRLTRAWAPQAQSALSLREIAERGGSTWQEPLTELAGALRKAIDDVRRESSIVRAAADALSRHITGVMQTVNSAMSRVQLYERCGRIAVGAQMDFCVDLKS
jgi:N-acetylglucosamine-6-phosphate deacetylase